MQIYRINPDATYGGSEEYPDSPIIPEGYTFSQPPEIPEGYYAVMVDGWQLVQGLPSTYPVAAVLSGLNQEANKKKAQELLYATDWTTIPDVTNPQVSNPYLANGSEFAAYRSSVRAIAVNPPEYLAEFPALPQEQWVTVPAA